MYLESVTGNFYHCELAFFKSTEDILDNTTRSGSIMSTEELYRI